jgi:tripartite-type tricarboxylate transporter receptor subunit TctC
MTVNYRLLQRCAAVLLLALAAPALAQSPYPSRPVTLIVPFAPGGGTDGTARLLAQKLSVLWGQQMVVDNRGGAGGIVGMELGARAKPDGYTLVMGNVGTLAINPALYKKLPYDPQHDFAPVSMMAELPLVLVLSPSFKVANVKELVELGKKEPGKFSYASSGTGNSTHLAAEIFEAASGTRFIHVPYKGGGQANADVMAGHVQFQFTSVFGNVGLIESGKLRAIATASDARVPVLPNVPTLAEAGVPNAEMGSWVGIFAPAGTPQAIIDKVAADMRAVVNAADTRDTLIAQGATPRTTTPAEFQKVVASDTKKFAELIKRLGLQAE